MNKQEAIERVKEIDTEREALQRIIDNPYERWTPKKGETYYYIATYGGIFSTLNQNGDSDLYRIKTRNCFKTEEETVEAIEKELLQASRGKLER